MYEEIEWIFQGKHVWNSLEKFSWKRLKNFYILFFCKNSLGRGKVFGKLSENSRVVMVYDPMAAQSFKVQTQNMTRQNVYKL